MFVGRVGLLLLLFSECGLRPRRLDLPCSSYSPPPPCFSHQPLFVRALWLTHFLVSKVVVYLFLDGIDRALVLPLVYRNYSGIAVDEADQIAKLAFERYMKPRIRDEARREVREEPTEGETRG